MEGKESRNLEGTYQESLRPQRIPKDKEAYQSVLDINERLQKKDATNIALTGPYGSGKSSILYTLKEDYPEYHYLDISLATLKPLKEASSEKDLIEESEEKEGHLKKNVQTKSKEKQEREQEEEEEEKQPSGQNIDRLIEYSILQQLIYREKQKTLQNSRFKRIYQLPHVKIRNITLSVILAIIAVIVVFEPGFVRVEWLCRFLGKTWLNIVGDILGIVYLLLFTYKVIFEIVPAISASRLNKLNLKDGEIEIVKNTSIFNKHLDEILYFFEQTQYDVILLEDLDRFESTEIFLKLRELNLMLNASKVVNRTIVFIYAVRDDMFQDEGRVKCFDYISTVIPVINPSNAKSKLKEELEKRGVYEIKEACLRELGFFMHDMRLLKNIANEYVQYRARLSKGISCDKLLGMIVYKNYYPQDFSDLHDGKGVVYELLNLKDAFVAARIDKLEVENKEKQETRAVYLKERHLKEKELRRLYVEAYRDKVGNNALSLKAGDGMYGFSNIAADEKLFEKLIADPNVTFSYNTITTYPVRTVQKTVVLPFTEIEKCVDDSLSYRDRIDALRNGFASLEDGVMVDIRKEDIRSQTLSQIMSEIDYASFEEYQELKVPAMIEYLVSHGYIDENYYDYISYFYGNFIDPHDWEFVLDLKLFKAHSYDFHVNSVVACLEEIPPLVYRKSAILNVDIMDYLASHSSDNSNRRRMLLMIRTALTEKKYDFLEAYYQIGKQQDIMFDCLFGQHKDLWKIFEKNDDEKHSLKLSWFKYAEKEQRCDESQKWLSANFGFITDNLLEIDENQWVSLIQKGNYVFEELNGVSNELLKTVADKNAYKITRHNVETLVASLLDMNAGPISYRLVLETKHEALINRVEENLGECMKSIFAAPESERESEAAIIGILQSHEAVEEDKIAYLKKQYNKIDLEELEHNEDKALALKSDVVAVTWGNVIHYMNEVSEHKTDDVLTTYVEIHADTLAGEEVPKDPNENARMLLREYVASDRLSLNAYESILDRFKHWYYTNVPIIQEERVSLMIDRGMVHFTDENTAILQENYSATTVAAYLLENKTEFLQKKDTVVYTTELAHILMSSSMTLQEKASIIPLFKKEIMNAEVADEVVSVLAVAPISLEPDCLFAVMSLSQKTNDKISVLINALKKNLLDGSYVTSILKTLPEPYSIITKKGKKPVLPDTDQARELVEELKRNGYISTTSPAKKGIRVNTKLK